MAVVEPVGLGLAVALAVPLPVGVAEGLALGVWVALAVPVGEARGGRTRTLALNGSDGACIRTAPYGHEMCINLRMPNIHLVAWWALLHAC